MAEQLAGGNTAIALLANSAATGCVLYVGITILGPVSGAHFNPAVTLAFVLNKEMRMPEACGYAAIQVAGGIAGVWLAHAMFDLALLQVSTTTRTGPAQWLAEAIAALGLVLTILGGLKFRSESVPALVALYIAGGLLVHFIDEFRKSRSHRARSLTDTFAGIVPAHAPAFIVAQLVGAALRFSWRKGCLAMVKLDILSDRSVLGAILARPNWTMRWSRQAAIRSRLNGIRSN